MKKLVTGILAMLLCFGCLAGCGSVIGITAAIPALFVAASILLKKREN